MKNKSNGPADCLVTGMLQCLPMETVYEVTHWFETRFTGERRAPEAWKILRLVRRQAGDRDMRVGADGGVNCEHVQTVLTNILQRQREWQEDRRTELEPGPNPQ